MTGDRPAVLKHVAANVRRLRTGRGLSQQELADAAGISRRTLINLEGGQANVSLSALDTLAAALGARFVDLISAPNTPASHIDALAWTGTDETSRAVLLGSAPAAQEGQLWRWSLGVGDRYDAHPDPDGWYEMILVTGGHLQLVREDAIEVLDPSDHAIYSSAQRYSYVNVGESTTEFVRVVLS